MVKVARTSLARTIKLGEIGLKIRQHFSIIKKVNSLHVFSIIFENLHYNFPLRPPTNFEVVRSVVERKAKKLSVRRYHFQVCSLTVIHRLASSRRITWKAATHSFRIKRPKVPRRVAHARNNLLNLMRP